MSDDEDVQLMEDGPEGGGMDEEAQLFGAAQAFDAATGMPVPRAGSVANSASSSSNERRAAELADIAAQVTSKPEPVWNLTLAQKNESNTGDIKVPHMLGIDEAGRGPVLGQCDKDTHRRHIRGDVEWNASARAVHSQAGPTTVLRCICALSSTSSSLQVRWCTASVGAPSRSSTI
jgi:hypothetical protein